MMIYSKSDVAAVVTLYNSAPDVIENIATYSSQVDKLYVVDNSERQNFDLEFKLRSFHNLVYIPLGDNLGIGYALNIAALEAIRQNYHFLLTMDDDSKAPPALVESMLYFFSNQKEYSVGIVSVNHSVKQVNLSYKPVLYTMTSGNLLNLNAYKSVGPFNEKLFIDHVDHEYCLRLNSNYFSVIELTDIQLIHRLGEDKQVKIFNRLFSFISHTPQRTYYIFRNGIFVGVKYAKRYPIFLIVVLKIISAEMIKIIFFEDSKLLRLKNSVKGIKHAFLNRLGRIDKPSK
jgi:rhamnosyltransferase